MPEASKEKNMKAKLEEGQIVLCTVTKIVGTTVFTKIEDYEIEGTISFPEIAPGRIRNIRDYAFPGKRIVCKVLSINPNFIELSLRRVKVNERNEFNELYKKEKSTIALLKTILGEKAEAVIATIKQTESSLIAFIERARENKDILNKYLEKPIAEKLASILTEKKVKELTLTKKFSLSSKSQEGIVLVKRIVSQSLQGIPHSEVSYIAAGKYLLKIKTNDPKTGDQNLRKIIDSIETLAKKNNCEFNEEKD